MHPLFLPFLILTALSTQCDHDGFEQYAIDFGKTYSSPEQKLLRQNIFISNCTIIEQSNAVETSFKLGVNELTDQTQQEIDKRLGVIIRPPKAGIKVASPKIKVKSAPTSFNWGNLCAITPIKMQGQCGACWAFSTVAAAESYIKINNGTETDLSQEYVLECTTDSDCTGGIPDLAMDLIVATGVPTQNTYPYRAMGGSSSKPSTPGICSARNTVKLPTGTVLATYYDVTGSQMKSLISSTPIVTFIWADSRFYSYRSGIFSCTRKTEVRDLNHGIMIFGYDTAGNYYIKNSWGVSWGVNGYGTVSAQNDCGVTIQVLQFQNKNFKSVLTGDRNCSSYNPPDDDKMSKHGRIVAVVGMLVMLVSVLLI